MTDKVSSDDPRQRWWHRIGRGLLRVTGVKALQRWVRARNPDALRENLAEALEEDSDDAALMATSFTPKERNMLRNLLGFRNVRVRDVMVPRADIFAIKEGENLASLHERFIASAHSRLPVYRDSLDNPQGMVHIKDALKALMENGEKSVRVADLQREALFVPPSMPALDLLLKMQASHIHLALVIDEYGGTMGLVSIENLVEEIVGEIEDEHDAQQPSELTQVTDGVLEAPARLPVRELEEHLSVSLRNGDKSDSDSVGGLVIALAGQVPQRGEVVQHPSGVEFEICDADARRIKHVRIRHKSAASAISDSEHVASQ